MHLLAVTSFAGALLIVALGAIVSAGEPATLRAFDRELRVMSFNVRYGTAPDGENHWNHRRALLLRTIDAFAPDLLGTQELLGFQADEIGNHLRGYSFFGVGRDDGKRKGEFCGMYFRADRFEKLDGGHFWLSEHLDQPGSITWDSAFTRMASWLKLREKPRDGRQAGRVFVWLNTHWDHQGKVAQVESAKVIRRQLEKLTERGSIPVILTGDLNCQVDSQAFAALMEPGPHVASGPLIDSFRVAHREAGRDEATYHAFNGTTAGPRIDYVLHSAAFETASATIDRTAEAGRFPSDHFPVEAVLRWREAPSSSGK